MKGQINLEFLAAALLFFAALGTVLTTNIGMPQFSDDFESASLNLEARQISNTVLTSTGRHNYGTGGPNWQRNNTTVDNTVSFGLSNRPMTIQRSKLERIRTAAYTKNKAYFNYTQFREILEPEHDYRFKFTWLPIMESPETFTRCSPPSNPSITEPSICGGSSSYYENSGNTVHYGEKYFNGQNIQYLVTSHNGVYNTTYINKGYSWDFSTTPPKGINDNIIIGGDNFTIQEIQNKDRTPGSFFIMENRLKTFGPRPDTNSRVISMFRYATMGGEPVRVEIQAW